MLKYRNNKGITLIALIVVIIVLLVIAGISIYEGKDLIKDAKVETLETNMLAIKAKAKAYAEEIEAKTWAEAEEKKQGKMDDLFGEVYMIPTSMNDNTVVSQISISSENAIMYNITNNSLDQMGLSELKEGNDEDIYYVVVFDKTAYNKIDVIYIQGIKYKDQRYYTLSSIQKIFDE